MSIIDKLLVLSCSVNVFRLYVSSPCPIYDTKNTDYVVWHLCLGFLLTIVKTFHSVYKVWIYLVAEMHLILVHCIQSDAIVDSSHLTFRIQCLLVFQYIKYAKLYTNILGFRSAQWQNMSKIVKITNRVSRGHKYFNF